MSVSQLTTWMPRYMTMSLLGLVNVGCIGTALSFSVFSESVHIHRGMRGVGENQAMRGFMHYRSFSKEYGGGGMATPLISRTIGVSMLVCILELFSRA